ncbi:MFS transporter [Nocardiopsis potens]|uniref:MFS transporter n=1 Tax=Nocardiopsis potens TaxID=1246458 RepID=UPI00034BFAD6|nr:MFS transporter [Nocardiopsis potens]
METEAGAGPAARTRAGRREWAGLAVLALPTLLLSLDMSVLHLALPELAADLRPTSTQLLWITDVYGFMIAGFLVTMGTLGDRIGRRRLLLAGSAAFGAASVLAAYASSAEALIAARTLLGVAGATLMPSTLALITGMFSDPRQRAGAISVWMSCFMGGTALGPLVGGVLLNWFWWGSVFLLGVPVMAVLLAAGPVLLPEQRAPRAGRPDPVSVALSLAAILPAMYGIKEAAAGGPVSGPAAAVALGALFGVLFVRRQLRLDDPLIDLRLFADRTFSTALAANLVGAVAMGGMFLLIAQYLQLVGGLSPLRAGLCLVPPTVAMITGTLLAPRVAARIGRGAVIGGGMLLAAAGFLLLSQVPAADGTLQVVAGMAVAATGLVPGAALVTGIVTGSAPPERAGAAASLSETSGEFGIAAGTALLGSLVTALYRTRVAVPEGPAADEARDTLAGAAAAAEGLPAAEAAELLGSAREAFTAGMNLSAGLAAVAVAVTGALVWRLLGPGPQAPVRADGGDDRGTAPAAEEAPAGR